MNKFLKILLVSALTIFLGTATASAEPNLQSIIDKITQAPNFWGAKTTHDVDLPETHNKRMPSDHTSRYVPCVAADAGVKNPKIFISLFLRFVK